MGFATIAELILQAQEQHCTIAEVVLAYEAQLQQISEEQVKAQMKASWEVMKQSVEEGIAYPQKSKGGLIGGQAKLLFDYTQQNKTLSGLSMNRAVAYALSVAEVNATMGKIVACPTAGSCGIVPGVLLEVQQRLQLSDDEVVMGLLTAAGFGIVIAQKASIAGAVCGCQAECGAAAAMAAAASVELAKGSPEQAGHACGFVFKNVMGLVCDPVAGLVEVPCAKRNAMGAAVALTSADMALAGIESVIPVDEVIMAMNAVGRSLPESLRETAQGGLAVTPTGLALAKEIFG